MARGEGYYDGFRIVVGSKQDRRTVAHEKGHWLWAQLPHKARRRFVAAVCARSPLDLRRPAWKVVREAFDESTTGTHPFVEEVWAEAFAADRMGERGLPRWLRREVVTALGILAAKAS